MKAYRYLCCCSDLTQPLDIDALNQMVRDAKQVTYKTLLRNCVGLREWARERGYDDRKTQGLTLKGDWHVEFCKSKIFDHQCYFVRWSRIEFIWVLSPRKGAHAGGQAETAALGDSGGPCQDQSAARS